MAYLNQSDRFQLSFSCLDEHICQDNPVRFIDAFVEHLDLSQTGFSINAIKTEGRRAFNPKIFLKLYLYGYLNGLRSSRKLERECTRNIEVQWLLGKLVPNYHSIADFRKLNPVALKSTFKLFVLFLKDADLIAGEVVAIDGTKVRASNSKKNNYNQKKIDRQLAYIEEKTNEYLAELAANDTKEDPIKVSKVQQQIDRLKHNKLGYEQLQTQLVASGQPQISTTDSDARALLVQGQVVEVAYNVQAAVDDKHKLVVATHTINRNDRNAMSGMVLETKANIEPEQLTVLLDKGYHNGREIHTCQAAEVTTIVAVPTIVNSNEKGTQPEYLVTKFTYDKQKDCYTCPQGETLKTTGKWHHKSRELNAGYRFKKYRTPACKTCPVRNLCTSKADGRREIERSEYAEAVEKNAANYKANTQLYRKRQEINEHIFGTIKRQWGYYYTNLRGLEKVNGEMALIATVYNIRRCINILGMEKLLAKLKNWKPDYAKATRFSKNRAKIKRYVLFYFLSIICSLQKQRALQCTKTNFKIDFHSDFQ